MKTLMKLLFVPLIAVSLACTPMGPTTTSTVDSVDVEQYLGTWYEVASVKQFFSAGLVNTTAEYSLNPNGTIRVFNSGNYFFNDGPRSEIVGQAVALDASNARLNVSFGVPASAEGLGNYWIVDLDEDYQWAIVSDPTGQSGFFLSRSKTITDELRAELYERAAAKGVNTAGFTETVQY